MDKRFIPVAMLAGALALAGCGGGSDTPAASSGQNPPANGTNPPASSNNELKPLALPAAANLSLKNTDAPQGTIPADGYRDFGNVRISCPKGTAPCAYEIRGGRVYANNGAEPSIVQAPGLPRVPTATSSVERGHWLDDDNLVEGVGRINQGDANEITLPRGAARIPIQISTFTPGLDGNLDGTDDAVSAMSGDWTGTPTNTVLEDYDRETKLRLAHTREAQGSAVTDAATRNYDYLVYGAWEQQSTQASAGYPTERTMGVLAAGSDPYGITPARDLRNATYKGGVLGFHKLGSGDWNEMAGGIVLKASFGEQLISGVIDIQDNVVTGGATGITIPKTPIRSNTVTGTGLKFIGEGPGTAAESGTWNGEFFGLVGRDGPSGVAGDFSVARPALGSTQSYDVTGAFGAQVITEDTN